MRKKKFHIGLLVAIIIIVAGGIIVRFLNKGTESTESMGSTEGTEKTEGTERTYEEYISIFLDNREDFEYVAEMMQQWSEMTVIDFENGISSEDPEIADEIANNEEFYEHLKNLYDLKEVSFIINEEEKIAFRLSKPMKYCAGGFYYGENMTIDVEWGESRIDEHWMMGMYLRSCEVYE